ncbi:MULTISPECIES: agmatinase [Aneurinibacillus]|uniref:Agmatinase n=1 Tax=Aneurinibacillus thermoaerophilus TaxID=143495 RepID=A0A1G8E4C3_ANETH|nr:MULTISPECIES: agmatinase [Aneurinibacillus]AMA74203.1 agmatinase [Aneurinibacillus sp. XH2]MED0676938.1 agmatinase [Aneurinibacillus thermoaerophilus]MED0738254.1 agmatinase [Aneurinibacillus thermoaerophilus]MED0757541.1 agmatinase [Aneurinibacillus thermoaerophilus]MED0760117.1 agmatinase [Aneurinibacillus thermoaerophilus]
MTKKYEPANSFESPRFCGVRTFMRLPYVQTTEDVDFVVLGAPFDTGASFRAGARFGPGAVRDFSILLRPYNPVRKINVFDYLSGVDYGDLPVVPGYIEESYKKIEEGLLPILEKGVVPITIGGDHSITLAELRAVAKAYGPVGLVHFDAHSDTWDSYFGKKYNHGTPFRRAYEEGLLDMNRCIQVGMRGGLYAPEDLDDARNMGFDVVEMHEVQEMGIPAVIERIRKRAGHGPLFLSFDIDFIDPAYAPGTGTPEVAGATTTEALQLVRGLEGLNFVAFDLVEVLPSFDHGQITANAASNVIFEFITHLALQKKVEQEAVAHGESTQNR